MMRVEIEKGKFLEVDLEKLVSPREEEVTGYRFAGKSKEAIATILGISPETVKKQTQSVYRKTGVDGCDNPLAMLQSKAFLHQWARFCVLFLVVCTSFSAPRLRVSSPSPRPSQSTALRTIRNNYKQIA